MKLIRPVAVDDDVLTASSVPEDEPVWNSGATYALNAVVRGSGDYAHRAFRSLQATNTNHALTPQVGNTWWEEIGATNRWKMYDGSVQSQTVRAEGIQVEHLPPTRVDSVALLNVDAASAQVTVIDPTEGVVFNQEYSLISDSGISDWYKFFFEPVERKPKLVVTGMPPLAGVTLAVTLSDPDGIAKCGALVPGLSREIGGTQFGVNLGIQDYSVKQRDQFGNFGVVERAFSERGNFTIFVANGYVDRLQSLLSGYRATAIVYLGDEAYGATALYGFYRDFSTVISYPDVSVLQLEIESLT